MENVTVLINLEWHTGIKCSCKFWVQPTPEMFSNFIGNLSNLKQCSPVISKANLINLGHATCFLKKSSKMIDFKYFIIISEQDYF